MASREDILLGYLMHPVRLIPLSLCPSSNANGVCCGDGRYRIQDLSCNYGVWFLYDHEAGIPFLPDSGEHFTANGLVTSDDLVITLDNIAQQGA